MRLALKIENMKFITLILLIFGFIVGCGDNSQNTSGERISFFEDESEDVIPLSDESEEEGTQEKSPSVLSDFPGTIVLGCEHIAINRTRPITAQHGVAFQVDIEASGACNARSCSLVQGPAWLTLEEEMLRGRPSVEGIQTARVRCCKSDGTSECAERELTIEAEEASEKALSPTLVDPIMGHPIGCNQPLSLEIVKIARDGLVLNTSSPDHVVELGKRVEVLFHLVGDPHVEISMTSQIKANARFEDCEYAERVDREIAGHIFGSRVLHYRCRDAESGEWLDWRPVREQDVKGHFATENKTWSEPLSARSPVNMHLVADIPDDDLDSYFVLSSNYNSFDGDLPFVYWEPGIRPIDLVTVTTRFTNCPASPTRTVHLTHQLTLPNETPSHANAECSMDIEDVYDTDENYTNMSLYFSWDPEYHPDNEHAFGASYATYEARYMLDECHGEGSFHENHRICEAWRPLEFDEDSRTFENLSDIRAITLDIADPIGDAACVTEDCEDQVDFDLKWIECRSNFRTWYWYDTENILDNNIVEDPDWNWGDGCDLGACDSLAFERFELYVAPEGRSIWSPRLNPHFD